MKLHLIFVTLTTVFASTEDIFSPIHYASELIDEQIGFVEHMIVTSEKYTKLDFLNNKTELLKDINMLIPEEEKKRYLLLHKCYNMISDRMNTFLKKHNDIYRGYFKLVFPENEALATPEAETALRKEHVKLSLELKHFFLHEMPNYYYEYGRNMGVNFTESELEKDHAVMNDARKRGTNESLAFAKEMGVEDIPFLVHTTNPSAGDST